MITVEVVEGFHVAHIITNYLNPSANIQKYVAKTK